MKCFLIYSLGGLTRVLLVRGGEKKRCKHYNFCVFYY